MRNTIEKLINMKEDIAIYPDKFVSLFIKGMGKYSDVV